MKRYSWIGIGVWLSLCPSLALPATFTIGTGTQNLILPLSTAYQDARSQVIYLASEIGTAGQISSLALDVATLPGQVMNNFTIRIKHTTLAAYATASWEGPASGWTTVYQANTTISAIGWYTFTFTTPFVYNGADNLMIDFSFNNASSTSNGGSRASVPGGNRTIYYRYNGTTYGDPLNWSGTSNPPPGPLHVHTQPSAGVFGSGQLQRHLHRAAMHQWDQSVCGAVHPD